MPFDSAEGGVPFAKKLEREVPQGRESRYVIGTKQNPDGSWDYSKAAVRLSSGEAKDAIEKAKQRDAIITGRIKHQIESNPYSVVDVERAREYWGRIYDESGQGVSMEMQLNEIYAQKYEEMARLAVEEMNKYERQLGGAKSEAERNALLLKLVEQRDFAIEMKEEARKRRGY